MAESSDFAPTHCPRCSIDRVLQVVQAQIGWQHVAPPASAWEEQALVGRQARGASRGDPAAVLVLSDPE